MTGRSAFWMKISAALVIEALKLSRDACRSYALEYSWEHSAKQFLGHVRKVASGNRREFESAMTVTETAAG